MKSAPIIALLALAVASCESKPEVKSDIASTANFQSYQTYAWVYQSPPKGMNPINYQRIHAAIDAQMAAKGYRSAPQSEANIAVVFTVGSREKVQVTDMGPYYGGWGRYYGGYGGGTSVDQYTEGTLAVDIFDVGTKQPVWHSTAKQRIADSGADPAMIDKVVVAAMASLPMRGGAAPPAQ